MHYRVYEVGNSGHYIKAHDIHAPHDGGALVSAETLLDERDVEVWQAGRFVARIIAERRGWSRRRAGRR